MTNPDTATVDTAAIRARIAQVQKLADRPGNAAEGLAALRMIARLQAKIAQAEQDGTAQVARYDNRWYGAKYADGNGLSTVQIAALIRADIKLARKVAKLAAAPGTLAVADPIADAPAQIRFYVRSQYFSMGSSISVGIDNVPDAWGYEDREDFQWGGTIHAQTDALAALVQAVEGIVAAYNHDGSDSQTDYFDVRFYGSVSASSDAPRVRR